MISESRLLQSKYKITAIFYDILDYPWERQYKKWRPGLLIDVYGNVLEPGVGTGRNLEYYHSDTNVTGMDISHEMLTRANERGRTAACTFHSIHDDAIYMKSIQSNQYDWLISTFLCCVMPDHLQPLAIEQFERVLKPGGRFRLLEMVYSKIPKLRKRQKLFSPFIKKVYGAQFDRKTLSHLEKSSILKITNTYFLKEDIYLVIEGFCRK